MTALKILRGYLYQYRLKRRFRCAVIHNQVIVDSNSKLGDKTVLFDKVRLIDSVIGSCSYIQENSSLNAVDVGPYCSIAANVSIGLVNHPTHFLGTSPVFYDDTQPLPSAFVRGNLYQKQIPRTVIEADVWIGDGVKICAGVRIGVGAVIGAGAIVTRDIPPYSIAAGVPCRVVRSRFNDELCYRLRASAWWDLPAETLLELSPYFSNPAEFLDAIDGKR
jgi:acetyltransferase-like isoleucine patch superfamily enzyme